MFPLVHFLSFSHPQATHLYKCYVTQVKPRASQKNHARCRGWVSYYRVVERNPHSLHYQALKSQEEPETNTEEHRDNIKLPQIPTKPNYTHSNRNNLTYRNKLPITQHTINYSLALNCSYTLTPDHSMIADIKFKKALMVYRLRPHRETWLQTEETLCSHCDVRQSFNPSLSASSIPK